MRDFLRAAQATALGVFLCVGGAAQADLADLDAEREAAFQAVYAAPGDPAAMMRYARAAIAMRDIEPAVATLERLLDIAPAHVAARTELAVAYFALGSNEIAAHHFRIVRAAPGQSAAAQAEIDDYLARIARRGARDQLSGSVGLGVSAVGGEDGIGGALQLDLRWLRDLGGANANHWQTDLLARATRSGADTASGGAVLALRTGPVLSLDGLAYGAKLRPYVAADFSRDGDGEDETALRLGLLYMNAHSARLTSFADLNIGRVAGEDDARSWSALAGITFRPTARTALRLTLRRSHAERDDAASSRLTTGARAALDHSLSLGSGPGARPVRLTGFVQLDQIDYFETPGGREDRLSAAGLSVRTPLRGDLFVEASARRVERDSSLSAHDDITPVFGLLIGRTF
ncbi:hypothetical protein [Poseidonocella sedimentorum]|uniref:Uncharacterized protein n=1 Tax=Poseidonocella sedimentorum TaxID=871652 RepID=A0A1I6DPN2_9RHOB|nr:hypothetical protein [Poseidonocella sedimentorum]SFR07322.1 hypothetical protein SAMN04515673_104211 [Poseidonocella sedimentorum]